MAWLENTTVMPNNRGVNSMKITLASIALVTLTGCATIQNYVPSFWDDNQSARIIDVRHKAHRIDCAQAQLPQAQAIVKDLEWFRLYSESKGLLQKDVIRLIEPIETTAREWEARSAKQEGSRVYCEMKKKALVHQTDRAASSILGRW